MTTQAPTEGRKVSWWRFPGTHVIGIGGVQGWAANTWTCDGWAVFVRLFMEKFQWSAAMLGGVSSVARFGVAWGSPAGGWTADNWGPRYATMFWATMMAVGWIGFYWLSEDYISVVILRGVLLSGT